ncbi:MAG: preprotein translocase subunit YajC [Candidatus Adiutrix sp.]|jgi:preprotein translocase subunit YajC|nr:preprotein translocase subunit YajC [Candidatus Adiutrix sp.]
MFSLNFAAALAWAADVVDGAAGGAAPQTQGLWTSVVMFGGMFAFIYFIMIRPQQKKQKEHQEMINSLQKGDRIQTSGGILGVITGSDQNELTVEIAPQVRVKVGRGFVSRVVKPGQGGEKDKK